MLTVPSGLLMTFGTSLAPAGSGTNRVRRSPVNRDGFVGVGLGVAAAVVVAGVDGAACADGDRRDRTIAVPTPPSTSTRASTPEPMNKPRRLRTAPGSGAATSDCCSVM